MRGNRLSSGLRTAIATLIAAVFATITCAAQETVLHSFGNGTDGTLPLAGLIFDGAGNLYGTTSLGGVNSQGAVFELSPQQGGGYTETVLHSFGGGTDGQFPYASSLVFDAAGNLYGTTQFGGIYNAGTVFELSPNGQGGWNEAVLYSFGNGTYDGQNPFTGLIFDAAGNLYGTTYDGGVYGFGTAFELSPNGHGGWTEAVLYSFGNGTGVGRYPRAGLTFDAAGNLYGVCKFGGLYGWGTAFELSPGQGGWTDTTLHTFNNNGSDGYEPLSKLAFDAAGNLYGTTNFGGSYCSGNGGCGTVFELTPAGGGAWTETVLHSFGNGTDGQLPIGSLIFDAAGNLYGTASGGGASNFGAVFKMSPAGGGSWTETVLYPFGGGTDGTDPWSNLIFDNAGNVYGTTRTGGSYCTGVGGCGTVFELQTGAPLYMLTVSPFGTGTVTSTDGFINCPGTCSHSYAPETQVTLNATAGQGWSFGGWNGAGCLGTGSCAITITQSSTVDAIFSQALQLITVTPCRVVDTRGQDGEFGGPALAGGTSRSFPIPQQTLCDIPASAAAYSLNVTVVPDGTLGYLTIWPTGENQPVVSTLNSTDGRIKANAAIVPAGTNGAVSVYVSNTTNVILDIDGYFTQPGSDTYQFYPLTPCRLVDTRGIDGPLGGPRLPAQTPRTFPLLESSCIPQGLNPLAYSLNFTVVPNPSGQQLGYLTVWPTGESQPVVSTLNNPTATVVANGAIVPAGTGGDIDVYAYNTTDLLIDVNGYFAAPGMGGLSMYSAAPCRLLDTRQNNGQPFMGEKTVNVVGSVCAPPSTAQAYIFNATVVPPGSMPYLTLWPDGEQQPVVSTLNAYDGFTTSNMAIVPTTNGSIDAWAQGLTQLILDISGYFAP